MSGEMELLVIGMGMGLRAMYLEVNRRVLARKIVRRAIRV